MAMHPQQLAQATWAAKAAATAAALAQPTPEQHGRHVLSNVPQQAAALGLPVGPEGAVDFAALYAQGFKDAMRLAAVQHQQHLVQQQMHARAHQRSPPASQKQQAVGGAAGGASRNPAAPPPPTPRRCAGCDAALRITSWDERNARRDRCAANASPTRWVCCSMCRRRRQQTQPLRRDPVQPAVRSVDNFAEAPRGRRVADVGVGSGRQRSKQLDSPVQFDQKRGRTFQADEQEAEAEHGATTVLAPAARARQWGGLLEWRGAGGHRQRDLLHPQLHHCRQNTGAVRLAWRQRQESVQSRRLLYVCARPQPLLQAWGEWMVPV